MFCNFSLNSSRKITDPATFHRLRVPVIVSMAMLMTLSNMSYAFSFSMERFQARLDTTLSLGASMRLEDQSPYQVSVLDEGLGGSLNTDDGNLAYDQHDLYSVVLKGSTDFMLSADTYGVFTRAKYWYDFKREDQDSRAPFRANSDIDDSDIELMDAYLWKDFLLGEQMLTVRLGYQVVNWGESTFIVNGVNVVNPVDLEAYRLPGAEVKDVLLPVNMLYASTGITDDVSMEAYYQLEHETVTLEDCGTFFSSFDYIADHCDPIYVSPLDPNQRLTRMDDKDASSDGQFGIALKWFALDWNETEFGVYHIQYHSRFPTVGGRVSQNPLDPFNPQTGTKYFVEYPEGIKLTGISFNTSGPWGSSLSGEYSYKSDVPIQYNAQDFILGALSQPISPVFQHKVSDADGNGTIDATDAFIGGFYGSEQSGYDLYDVSQVQFTMINFIDQMAGSNRTMLVTEVGATYVHALPDPDDGGIRYGRNEQAGFGLTKVGYAGCAATNQLVSAKNACTSDGYVTQFSWGYRALLSLEYENVFSGVNLTPKLAWSHDVEGYAPEPGGSFMENRRTLGLSMTMDYLNAIEVDVSYVRYMGSRLYNAMVDRDHMSASVSYSF